MCVELFDSFEKNKRKQSLKRTDQTMNRDVRQKVSENMRKKEIRKRKSQFQFISDFTRNIFEPN